MHSILSIEDNLISVHLLRRYFKHTIMTLHEATTGQAGIEIATQQHPDLILLDYHLPDADGCTIAQALRQIEGLADVPIIGLTADDTPILERQLLRAGFDKVLTKPVSVVTLMQTIEQFLHIRLMDIA